MILRIVLSAGEPAGIGPELIAAAAARGFADIELIAVGDPELFEAAAHVIRTPLQLLRFDAGAVAVASLPGQLRYVPSRLAQTNEFGFLRQSNAHYVLNVLTRAAAGCISGEFDALVTGPLHKGVINDAGVPFSGHTEYLQQIAGGAPVVMLLATTTLRVALATTHLPLRRVPFELTQAKLRECILVIHSGLKRDFGVALPRIGVLGLNPHAGEGGHLGSEEIDTIIPVLNELRAQGLTLHGPWPADTAFIPARLKEVDVVLAMYHDQGLPVLKAQGFGEAVNITLGLPFIRTSVDHGTALDLAGKALAEPNSFFAAIEMAAQLAKRRLQPSSA